MAKYKIVYQNWLPYKGNSDTRGYISQRYTNVHRAIDSVGNYTRGHLYTPVHSVMDGVVTEAYFDRWYGNVVTVSNNYISITYCHLAKLLTSTGKQVKTGDIVGHEGKTGKYARGGKHLHTKMSIDGKEVDPELYLAGKRELPKKVSYISDDIDQLAWDVIRGKYGNGAARKNALGDKYEAVQERVNELLREMQK